MPAGVLHPVVLVVLCGPPGVGKTTVAERLRIRLSERGHEFRVLHSDDFPRNTYERMYDTVAEDVQDADHPTDWLLDGTFYRREYQERFCALPDAHLVSLTASLEIALERNRGRADSIAEAGVRAMYADFEEPDHPDLTLDTEELSVEQAVDALERYVLTWSDQVD